MSKKSDPTSKARSNPFTPMRRFFVKLELLKPIVALGKRVRDQSHVADAEKRSLQTTEYPPIGSSSFITTEPRTTLMKDLVHQQTRQGTARIALQQHDQPLDTIVITTLPSYPFCCHEDLLMMSRSQLVEAAGLLNSRLPACSQIKLADGIPDAHIRHSIETLVGIVPEMPGAPRAIKSRPVERMDAREIDLLSDPEQDVLPSPPTSPLSMRLSRRQEKALPVMIMSPPHLLERLEEEDESDFFMMKRPLKKKRKVSRSTTSEDVDMGGGGGTPTRTRDLRLPMSLESPTFLDHASSHMVLRSHSRRRIHALLEQQSSPSPFSSPSVFKVDSMLVNLKPRHRSMGKNGRKTGGNNKQPGSSRKINKAKRDYTMRKHDSSFKLPASNSNRYTMRNKPLSSSASTSSSVVIAAGCSDESDNNNTGTCWFGNAKSHDSGIFERQMTGGIENMSVGDETM